MAEAALAGAVTRGPIQRALLALLRQQPRHGYELRNRFTAALGGHWALNSGQIYSSLERLARDGLVAAVSVEKGGGPERRIWALTERGAAELAAWLQAPVPRDDRLRDELYLKLVLAVLTAAERPDAVIQAQRRQLFRELHDLTVRRNALDPDRELARILLLDSAILHTEAELRWLDMVEARLDHLRAQPPPAPAPRPRGRPRRAAASEP